MNNPDPSFIATPVTGAVGAILTIAQAVPAIDKRLGRISQVENQIGRLPPLVRWIYVRAQNLYKWTLILITLVGLVMVMAYIAPATFTGSVFRLLRENGVALIAVWLLIGATMYTNFLSRVAIWLGFGFTSLVPFRTAVNVQRLDHHADWQALRSFVDLNEAAMPLIVNRKAIVTFVDALLRMLNETKTVRNRALPPECPNGLNFGMFRRRLGNGLLAACIVEELHYEPGTTFKSRDWGPFYDAVGDLIVGTELFAPETVILRHNSDEYFTEILKELNKCLLLRKQSELPESIELKTRWRGSFTWLVEKFNGDATNIAPRTASFIRSRMDIIYRRIDQFPTLKDEGMRAQFVKLAAVWSVWPGISRLDFRFPFSKSVAALFMDRKIVAVPNDVEVLAFDRAEEREVQRTAMKLIVDRTYSLVADRRATQTWLPAASESANEEEFRWWLTYELDFRTWDYAQRLHRGVDVPADDRLTYWNYVGGQVSRMKSQ